MKRFFKAVTLFVFLFSSNCVLAQVIPYLSCNQSTLNPLYTFSIAGTYTLQPAVNTEEIVFLSCPNTLVYDTVITGYVGRHCIVNSNCHYISNFGNSTTFYACFVKSTGTLTIKPNPLGTIYIVKEIGATIINLSSQTINTSTCANISIPSYSCNDVGLLELIENNSVVLLFPNPANDKLNINFKGSVNFKSVQLTNSVGQLIREEEIKLINNPITLNTADLTNGVYFLKLVSSSSTQITKRFVIAR